MSDVFDPETQQARPRGSGPSMHTLLAADIEKRAAMGERKYGERLKANNGRDALLDMYEELLDAAMYCRQMLYERDGE